MRNGNILITTIFICLMFRSYPTYEEWKPSTFSTSPSSSSVLILPMRNGNSLHNQFRDGGPCVLILPMRNGNFAASIVARFEFSVLILPMRNGNDSSKLVGFEPTTSRSYPTYEEWKPSKTIQV